MNQRDAELFNDVSNLIYDSLVKLNYYILGLSVAAIGYTIHFITQRMTEPQISVLLLSTVIWAITFCIGIKQLQLLTHLLALNQQKIKRQVVHMDLNRTSRKLEKWHVYMLVSFGLGFLPYIYWLLQALSIIPPLRLF